jgi:hypothetical protein
MRLAWINNVTASTTSDTGPDGAAAGAPDDVYEALEGRIIKLFDRAWRVRVYGICDADRWRWLQLSLEGSPDYAVTVRTSPSTGASATVRVLTRWLANPDATPPQLIAE